MVLASAALGVHSTAGSRSYLQPQHFRRPSIDRKWWLCGNSKRLVSHRAAPEPQRRVRVLANNNERKAGNIWNRAEGSQIDLGRRALVSAAAAFLVQFVASHEFFTTALASTYPAPAGAHSSLPLSGSSAAHCADSRNSFTYKAMKRSRGGVIATAVSTKQPSSGQRRAGLALVKRPSSAFYHLKESLLARQVYCSSVGVPTIASISASAFANSIAAISGLVVKLDLNVLRSSAGTSINLLSLCTLVVWMQRSGQLPAETPVILSQVAFKLFIPCFLTSKVARTLISQPVGNLVALPLMAVVQVIVGATLGKVACRVFIKEPALQSAVWSGSDGGESSSLSVPFTEKQQQLSRRATKKHALITAACAFGNSLTLPLVFLSGVLASPEDSNRAAGYLALYMVGWSPGMWTMGYKILTSGDEETKSKSLAGRSRWQMLSSWIGSVMNPPLYGVFMGLIIGGTPLSHLFLGGREGVELAISPFDTIGTVANLRSFTAGILSSVFEAVTLLGTATLAVQTVVLATSLGASLAREGGESRSMTSIEVDSRKNELSGDSNINITKSEGTLDTKSFWVIAFVRLMVLPVTGIILTSILTRANMLPPDPIYRLTILAETAMPTAQNLVLLAQLNPGTRPLAGPLAELLLKQYALSVISITIWMAVFLTINPI